jgi:hypothetical protein
MSENQIKFNEEDPNTSGSQMNVENTLNIHGLILNEEEPNKTPLEIPKETTYDQNKLLRRESDRNHQDHDHERERERREREKRHRERKRSRERRRSKDRERREKRRRREEQLKEGDSFEDLDEEDRKMMEELAHPEKKKNEAPPSNLFKNKKNEDDNDSAEDDDDYPPDFARDSKKSHRYRSPSPLKRGGRSSRDFGWSPRKEDDSKWAYTEPNMSPEEELKKKQEILEGFDKLSRKGVRIHRVFDINSDLRDMEAEYNRLVRQREIENSIKFQRKMLMAFVTGVEFLNNRYNPFDLDLDGWSEVVMSDVDSYDDIFEELYEKYHTKVNMAPELRLMFTLGGSAIMFHLTNTMFKSALPGMNPNMAKGMQKMAMNAMRGGFGGNANNNRGPPPQGPPGGFPGFPFGGPPGPSNQMPPRGPRGPPGPPPQRPRQSRGSNQVPQPGISTKRPSPKRREMRGPKNTDLDDILNDLNLPDDDINTDIEALLHSDDSEETKHISLKQKDGITLKGK